VFLTLFAGHHFNDFHDTIENNWLPIIVKVASLINKSRWLSALNDRFKAVLRLQRLGALMSYRVVTSEINTNFSTSFLSEFSWP
jgi:hypothetical protein